SMRTRRIGDRGDVERGFTLIEFLFVIAVMSILSSVVLDNVTGIKNAGAAVASRSDATLAQDIRNETDAITDQADATSLQSVAWRLVVTTTSADPAGSLDQGEIDALDQSLTDHEARLQRLLARVDAVLAGNLTQQDRQAWSTMRVSLAGALDGVEKMEQVVRP